MRTIQAINQETRVSGHSGDTRQKSQTPSFTYEVDCLVEPGTDVRFVVVLDRNALVLVVTLKVVRTIGRDVDQGSDAQGIKHVLPGSMIGTAQVQEGQDLHWAPLESKTDQHSSSLFRINTSTHAHKNSLLKKGVSDPGDLSTVDDILK